jgi:leucine dehydrogenase
MSVFDHPDFDAHEHVSFFAEPSAGLRAIIAIHDSGPLGLAGGGCRLWPYASDEAALRDVLRLSRAMTYKLALAEIPAGGAKAVVIADAAHKTEALLEALGRAVDRLGGRFIISEDVGTTPADLAIVGRRTAWVSREAATATTADATAYGVLVGMRVAVARRLGRSDLRGLGVAVQGLGRVGGALCRLLAGEGARIFASDVDAARMAAVCREVGATAVSPSGIFDQPVDIFAPCALGDALDTSTVARLRCSIVAGSANNQLADASAAELLTRRGILYAPDIVINAGGVIAAGAGESISAADLRARLDRLAPLIDDVFARAERLGISTQASAEGLARELVARRSR